MDRRSRRGAALLALLALLSTIVLGCSSEPEPSAAPSERQQVDAATVAAETGEVLVGEVDGGNALIAIVHTASALTVYTCGFDDHLETHTGWFNGEPAVDGDARTIPELTSAGDLRLRGQIDGDDASGTLTLASGDDVDWSAHRVSGNGAGLYSADDAVSLAGLIVAEDGRMVGAANVRLSGTATGTGTSTGATTPRPPVVTSTSTTSTTRPSSTTTSTTAPPTTRPGSSVPKVPVLATPPVKITPPSTRPTGTPTTVTFPTPTTTRTVTLPPVTKPRTVTRTGPAIVFLVHGMSDKAPPPAAQPDPVACDGPRDTPFYGRCEWGPDVIPGLYGSDPGMQLTNLAGQDQTGDRFITSAVSLATFDESMGIAEGANGCATDPTETEELDPRTAAHFVAPPLPAQVANAPIPVPPMLSVFTTWRDSTGGMVASGRRLARQAYAAARWWEETYQLTPQIVFVAQSFGGLATRFVLSNPTDESIAGLNPDGVVLCPEDHARMDYLRNRTTYATTLATPHEGSFLAEVGEPAKAELRSALGQLDNAVDNRLALAVGALDDALHLVDPSAPSLRDTAHATIADLIDLLSTPALRDMQLDVMRRWNVGPIAPDRARRTRGSPIVGAAGELIPIYATLARSPGSTAFTSPLLLEGLDIYSAERPKVQGWIVMTNIIAELIVTQLSPVGCGAIDGQLAPFADLLDQRARLFDLGSETNAAERFVEDLAEDALSAPNLYFSGEFGPGVDGVLAYLDSVEAQAFFPTLEVPLYLDHVWTIDLSGSVEVPMLALTCGANRIVVDYEPLVQATLAAHDRTNQAIEAIGSGDIAAMIAAADAAIDDGSELAIGTVDWFQGKIAALDNVTGDDCKVPVDAEDLITDALSLGNVTHWRVSATTGTVPAPAWHETDEVARDGEQDTDGAVHAASALGLQLGQEPFFFEHDRGGSWYRLPDEPVTAQFNHGLQYQNEVGRWVRDRLFARGVGPVPQAQGDSAWPA